MVSINCFIGFSYLLKQGFSLSGAVSRFCKTQAKYVSPNKYSYLRGNLMRTYLKGDKSNDNSIIYLMVAFSYLLIATLQ
jgi:hypothetical protein